MVKEENKQRILVVDDSTFEANQITKELEGQGYNVTCAFSGADGVNKAIDLLPDVILLDIILPDKTGYDVCRVLKSHKRTRYIPIILTTVKGSQEDKIIGFGCGANDYVTKPYDTTELLARITACLRVKESIDELISDREETLAHLRIAKQMALTDPVTGLFNRRYFNDVLTQEFLRSQRYGSTFSCLMIDIDDFKQINDSFSHDVGDAVLCELSKVIKAQIRDVDIPARYGGDEFAVLLPQSDLEMAVQVAERILKEVRKHSFSRMPGWKGRNTEGARDNASGGLTVSIGVSGLHHKHITQAFQVLSSADLALLRAKKKGRDQVEVAVDEDVGPLMPIL